MFSGVIVKDCSMNKWDKNGPILEVCDSDHHEINYFSDMLNPLTRNEKISYNAGSQLPKMTVLQPF